MAMKRVEDLRVGNDGYYYFTYNVGAKYEIKTPMGTVIYEIVSVGMVEENQIYCIHVQGEAINMYREMPIQRLQYILLSAQGVNKIEDGEPEELPATKAEVELYYSRYVKLRNKRKREANAKLKEDKDYQKLVLEEKELTPKWAQAICKESAEAFEIEEKINRLTTEKRAIIEKLGIRLSDLKAPEVCATCGDKGITAKGQICACAIERSAQIKAYCSAERLVERKKEEKMYENEDSENSRR